MLEVCYGVRLDPCQETEETPAEYGLDLVQVRNRNQLTVPVFPLQRQTVGKAHPVGRDVVDGSESVVVDMMEL